MGKPIKIAILADGKQAKKETADTASSMGDSFGKLLDGLKLVPALAAGAAVGGLLVKGFTDALDLEDARGVMTAQLGLTGPESAKAGKIAGDLYKEAYGESISDVNDALKNVFQQGLATMGDSEDKIKGIARASFNASKVMGEELLPTTRAVSQMLRNGLAKDANEAFDILVRGTQLGVNKSEDLLDTFNEYGTQFRKLGLSGKDALGLMNQLLQGGARDADTAADAIKEFAIRAVDGSTTSAAGFKALGLDAKALTAEIGKGGPAARTAFGNILDGLNGITDPVKREAAGVALFGTKWEDLGGAVKRADLDTAAASLGQVGGSTDRAGDAMTTTKTKLTQLSRTISQTLTEAIAKYALPKLNQFVSWFQGPGKFAIAEWAVGAGQDVLTFLDGLLGGLQATVPAVSKFAAVVLYAAAAQAALTGDVGLVKNLIKQGREMDEWGATAKENIGNARESLQGWNDALEKTKTRIKFEADIEDLDTKINKARTELKDPKLTATRRAKLTADIAELEARKTAAIKNLGDPKLIATRTAKLTADKKTLDSQIAKAKGELSSKDLTRERRAKLNADIAALVAKRKQASAELAKLHPVTVPVTVKLTYVGGALKGQPGSSDLGGLFPSKNKKAGGGRVFKGQTYLVGEEGPEVITMGANGFVTPNNRLSASTLGAAGSGAGGGAVVVNVYALADGPDVGRRVVQTIKEYEQFNGTGWRRSA